MQTCQKFRKKKQHNAYTPKQHPDKQGTEIRKIKTWRLNNQVMAEAAYVLNVLRVTLKSHNI